MSKLLDQMHGDHQDLQLLLKDRTKSNEKRFDEINDNISELKEDLDEKFDMILNILLNQGTERRTDSPLEKEDKHKIDLDTPTFIPEIDISDLSINAKDEEDTIKNLDLEPGLDALEELDKQ